MRKPEYINGHRVVDYDDDDYDEIMAESKEAPFTLDGRTYSQYYRDKYGRPDEDNYDPDYPYEFDDDDD